MIDEPRLPAGMRQRITVLPTGCWNWDGSIATTGYGQFFIHQKSHYVHRLMYEMLIGPIPQGLQIDHLCRVRTCCNPEHLEAVTAAENKRRGNGPAAVNSRKTHCLNGHEFTPENIYTTPSGSRTCRACKAQRETAWRIANADRWREISRRAWTKSNRKRRAVA